MAWGGGGGGGQHLLLDEAGLIVAVSDLLISKHRLLHTGLCADSVCNHGQPSTWPLQLRLSLTVLSGPI